MASGGLSLFPQIPSAAPSEKQALLNASRMADAPTPAGLQGLAFQVTARRTPPRVRPATDAMKHTLPTGPSVSSDATPPLPSTEKSPSTDSKDRLAGGRPRAKRPANLNLVNHLDVEEDQLSPLPQKSDLKPRSRPVKLASLEARNRHIAHKTSVIVVPDADQCPSPMRDDDQLSPLPSRTRFQMASPSASEFAGSLRSSSPTLVASAASSMVGSPSSPVGGSAMRSMFPRYDPSRPLNQQKYFPTTRAPSRTEYLPETFSRVGSPDSQTVSRGLNPAFGLVDGFEHVPIAVADDLTALLESSRTNQPTKSRKAQFKLLQARGSFLAVGMSEDSIAFSMARDESQFVLEDSPSCGQLVIKKTNPLTPALTTVAQIPLPRKRPSSTHSQMTPIFPQAAALNALESLSKPSTSASDATRPTTPTSMHSTSRAKKSLSIFRMSRSSKFAKSHSALAEAQKLHTAGLTKLTRQRDSLGSVTATYNLQHPTAGNFPITVSKSQNPACRTGPRAKISLSPPKTSPHADASLVFFDFAFDACVVDIPLFLSLDTPHLIDTCLSALFAVAAIENEALLAETLVFAAPPRAPIKNGHSLSAKKHHSSRSRSKQPSNPHPKPLKPPKHLTNPKTYKALPSPSQKSALPRPTLPQSPKTTTTTTSFPPGEQVDLPFLTQSALTIIDVSLKSAVWLLNVGAKASTGVVLGVDRLAKKA